MTTYIIIAFTTFISYLGFKDREFTNKFMFNATAIYHQKDWKRMLTHGFLHANWMHLIFNMLTLYFFGDFVEKTFIMGYGHLWGTSIYLFLYLSAIPIASLISLFKYKDARWYNSLGASGAVSAILFAAILFNPSMKLLIMFIPIPIPAWLFGILYLGYTQYMSKQENDNVNHDAHFVGSVYGFLFPLLFNIQYIVYFVNTLIY